MKTKAAQQGSTASRRPAADSRSAAALLGPPQRGAGSARAGRHGAAEMQRPEAVCSARARVGPRRSWRIARRRGRRRTVLPLRARRAGRTPAGV